MSATDESEAVVAALKAGASLRYFFLSGNVAVHEKGGAPSKTVKCPIGVFLSLCEKGQVEMTRRRVSGYPHYAYNEVSDEYKYASAS